MALLGVGALVAACGQPGAPPRLEPVGSAVGVARSAEALEIIVEDDPTVRADESRLRWRLNNALRARQQAEAPRSNDGDAAAEDESSLSKHLSDLIASRAWEKKSR